MSARAFSAVVSAVCSDHGVKRAALLARSKHRELVRARADLYARLARLGWGDAEIARRAGVARSTVSATLTKIALAGDL